MLRVPLHLYLLHFLSTIHILYVNQQKHRIQHMAFFFFFFIIMFVSFIMYRIMNQRGWMHEAGFELLGSGQEYLKWLLSHRFSREVAHTHSLLPPISNQIKPNTHKSSILKQRKTMTSHTCLDNNKHNMCRQQIMDTSNLSQASQIATLLPVYTVKDVLRDRNLHSGVCHNCWSASSANTHITIILQFPWTNLLYHYCLCISYVA